MIRFRWRGIDAHGKRRCGTTHALDAAAVRDTLKQQRIAVIDIVQAGASSRWRTVRAADVSRATRQIASLLGAGLPLLQALQLVATHTGPSLAHVVAALSRDVASGRTLAQALGRYPATFPPVYRELVALGEKTGSLGPILDRLADDRERAAAQRAKVRGALTYPVIVLLLALGIATALLTWVVPTFEQCFSSFGATLPLATRAVLALSRGTLAYVPTALASLGCMAAGVTIASRHSVRVRYRLSAALLRLPVCGPLLRQLAIARWTHALGSLLHAGVPLADGFDAMSYATGNAVFDAATRDIMQRVRRGQRVAHAMGATGCFTPDVIAPIAVAEEAGTLDAMLIDLAAINDRQVEDQINTVSQFAEPLIIVGLGALIGGLVIAMYLPIIRIGSVV